MGAAKLLKEKRPKIFWTSCAAHSINIMLESIAKQTRFKKIIDQAKSLTIFLYAHHKVLAMMRAYTKQRDIMRPGVTRFASAYLTLESLNAKKVELKAMFGSSEWDECKFSKSAKGKTAYLTIVSLGFWNGVTLCLEVFEPLIRVLWIVDCDRKPSMGFVYGELLRAKEDIKRAFNNIPKNYEPIIQVIDERMKDRLNRSLHLTAYLLNLYCHYKDSRIHRDKDNTEAMVECIDIFFPGYEDMQNKIFMEELPKYNDKVGTFGKPTVVKACSSNDAAFDPVNWLRIFGGTTSNLKEVSMKILSLTSSSSGCERNWSAFEGVHTKKRNRLSAKLLKNLVFIQYNARLLSKQKREQDKNDIDVLSSYDATKAQEWIVDMIVDDDNEDGGEDDDEDDELRTSKYRTMSVRNIL